MAIPKLSDLKFWVGTLFTKDDWDFNFSQLVSWLADGDSDLVVGSIKSTNGVDLDGAQIRNVGAATEGSQAINLDQALTLLNRSSNYYPFSVASGKVDSNGQAAYIQKDSDTQVTILAGNTNPDLVCVSSDGTIESVTSNTVLTVPVNDGKYYILKEKENAITITTGASTKLTINKKFPTSPNIGDYYLDNSSIPFIGYKYTVSGWEEVSFCYLGFVTVSSGAATTYTPNYNDNWFDFNLKSNGWVLVNQQVGNATTTGTRLIPIADYLPDDGSYYQCLFTYNIRINTAGANGNYIIEDADKNIQYLYDSVDTPNTGDSVREGGQFIAFAKSSTTLNYKIDSGTLQSSNLVLLAYKKMNTEEI